MPKLLDYELLNQFISEEVVEPFYQKRLTNLSAVKSLGHEFDFQDLGGRKNLVIHKRFAGHVLSTRWNTGHASNLGINPQHLKVNLSFTGTCESANVVSRRRRLSLPQAN